MITLVVAVDENFGIGCNNELLCKLPRDLRNFKYLTQHKTVVMGRKTWESLPVIALPNRRNIIISKTLQSTDMFEVVDDWYMSDSDFIVIGGGSIYKHYIDIADEIYLTLIHHEFGNVDSWFPEIGDEWQVVEYEYCEESDENIYPITFLKYERIDLN